MGWYIDMRYLVVMVTPSNQLFIRLFGGSRGRSKTADSREIEGLSDDRRDMDTFSRDNRPKRRPTIRFER